MLNEIIDLNENEIEKSPYTQFIEFAKAKDEKGIRKMLAQYFAPPFAVYYPYVGEFLPEYKNKIRSNLEENGFKNPNVEHLIPGVHIITLLALMGEHDAVNFLIERFNPKVFKHEDALAKAGYGYTRLGCKFSALIGYSILHTKFETNFNLILDKIMTEPKEQHTQPDIQRWGVALALSPKEELWREHAKSLTPYQQFSCNISKTLWKLLLKNENVKKLKEDSEWINVSNEKRKRLLKRMFTTRSLNKLSSSQNEEYWKDMNEEQLWEAIPSAISAGYYEKLPSVIDISWDVEKILSVLRLLCIQGEINAIESFLEKNQTSLVVTSKGIGEVLAPYFSNKELFLRFLSFIKSSDLRVKLASYVEKSDNSFNIEHLTQQAACIHEAMREYRLDYIEARKFSELSSLEKVCLLQVATAFREEGEVAESKIKRPALPDEVIEQILAEVLNLTPDGAKNVIDSESAKEVITPSSAGKLKKALNEKIAKGAMDCWLAKSKALLFSYGGPAGSASFDQIQENYLKRL